MCIYYVLTFYITWLLFVKRMQWLYGYILISLFVSVHVMGEGIKLSRALPHPLCNFTQKSELYDRERIKYISRVWPNLPVQDQLPPLFLILKVTLRCVFEPHPGPQFFEQDTLPSVFQQYWLVPGKDKSVIWYEELLPSQSN